MFAVNDCTVVNLPTLYMRCVSHVHLMAIRLSGGHVYCRVEGDCIVFYPLDPDGWFQPVLRARWLPDFWEL